MSLTLPLLHVKKAQTLSDKIDFRFYDGKLYVSKIEPDGTILEGASLVVDRLPPEALYGENYSGETIAWAIKFKLNLPVDVDSLTQGQRDDIRDAISGAVSDATVKIGKHLGY